MNETIMDAGDVYHEPAALLKMAASLERFGDAPAAKGYYEKLLGLSYVDQNQRSIALQRLAAHAGTVAELRALSLEVLEQDPDNRRARNALSCLTPEMEGRLAVDPSGLLREAFRTPLNVQIQTISRCNASCVMCPYPTSWHAQNPGRMSDECFERVIQLLEGLPLGRLCLYLENEPFLDPALLDRLRAARSRLHFERVELSTNVSALTEGKSRDLVDQLRDLPHEIWISWHGTTEETYSAVMGLDFGRNLKRLRQFLRVSEGTIQTVIRSIVGSRHPQGAELETPARAREFLRREISEAGIDPDHGNVRVEVFEHHDRAGGVAIKRKDGSVVQLARSDPRVGRLKPYCGRIKNWFHVLYDGSIILCCMDYQKETARENVMSHERIEGLFGAPALEQLRKQALGQRPTQSDFICRRCTSPGG